MVTVQQSFLLVTKSVATGWLAVILRTVRQHFGFVFSVTSEIFFAWVLQQNTEFNLNWFLVVKSCQLHEHGVWWKRLLNIIDMLQEYQRRWEWGVRLVGSLSCDFQGWWWSLAQFGSIQTDRKRDERWVQKLDIFHWCHKCIVPTSL